jgi:thiol-disulfide isomerase/thioredoxin|eukprot:COSAG02_NODE_1481_length_12389_cov_15.643857_11_plen_118_part_00
MVLQPWCGHCKTLKPEYVEASSQAPRSFTFAAVDCTVHTDTCNAVGTSGYPTLRYFEPPVEGSDVEAKQPAVRAMHLTVVMHECSIESYMLYAQLVTQFPQLTDWTFGDRRERTTHR